MSPARPRVVVLTNIVAPYRLPAFAELAKTVDLRVLFCAETGSGGCGWRLHEEIPFRHRIIGGLALRRAGGDVYLSPRTLAAIARERPHVVISGGYSTPTLYAAAYTAATRCRLAIFSDGTSHSERRLSVAQQLARRVLVRAADACIAASEAAARRFLELGVEEERVFRSPHTTDIARYWQVALARNGHAGPGLRLLAVSRLVAGKGLDRLLLAVGRAAREESGIELEIVGSGPEEAKLRRLATDLRLANVEFRGFVGQQELPERYLKADAFAFPTLGDTFGIALLEAAASGLPSVASPHAGATPEFVRHGESGFIVDPGDTEAMAAALIALARDPQRRSRMGRAAHEATLTRTPAAAAAGYAAAIEQALGPGKHTLRTPAWA